MQFLIPAQHKTHAGIYAIRNTHDARCYVGSTQNLYSRYATHKSALANGRHHAARLQQFATEHGLDTLRFELLELAGTNQDLGALEQQWLAATQAQAQGFNSSDYARPRPVEPAKTRFALDLSPELLTGLETVLKNTGLSNLQEVVRFLLTTGVKRYHRRLRTHGPCQPAPGRPTAPIRYRA